MLAPSSGRTGIVLLAAFASLLAVVPASASSYCAHTSFDLYSALTDVSTGGVANGSDNAIHLISGTFATTGSTFSLSDTSGHALTIDGGYDDGCVHQDPTPGLTVLDGTATNQVISVATNGSIVMRHLTIQNGSHDGSAGGGAQIYLSDPGATALFENNVVRDNHSAYATGGLVVFGLGTARIRANLFSGNSAPAAAALSTSLGAGSTVYLSNNTIAGNNNTASNAMITALGGGSAGGVVSNNVSFGNSGTMAYDFYLYSFATFEFHDNVYHVVNGTATDNSSGNVDTDPKFVDAAGGNYHLSAASPLFGHGTATPAGGAANSDLDGHAYPSGGGIDLGAFEDTLFSDAFDGSP